MPEDTRDTDRDTWPAPPDGMQVGDLSFEKSILLLHQKMDVMGRELFQVEKQIRLIRRDLELTMNEVRRHGQCIAPVSSVVPLEDLAHD